MSTKSIGNRARGPTTVTDRSGVRTANPIANRSHFPQEPAGWRSIEFNFLSRSFGVTPSIPKYTRLSLYTFSAKLDKQTVSLAEFFKRSFSNRACASVGRPRNFSSSGRIFFACRATRLRVVDAIDAFMAIAVRKLYALS